MTRYIISGGDSTLTAQAEANFYSSMLTLAPTNPAVLLILFARPEHDYSQILEQTSQQISKYVNVSALNVASGSKSVFMKQLRLADIIIIRGGDTKKLLLALKKLNIKNADLSEKVIVGSSAGANVLASNYYSLTNKRVEAGLGLIKINLVVHYRSKKYKGIDWDGISLRFKDQLPTVALPEQILLTI